MLEWIWDIPVGTWLMLGIILVPIYGMLFAWILGKPRNLRLTMRGIIYLISCTILLWGGFTIVTFVIKFLFFR